MPRELAPPVTETHSRSVKQLPLAAGSMKGISRRAEHMLWVGRGAKQCAVQTARRADRLLSQPLVEPRCSVPVTALRTNLAVHDLEEAAPAQCETAAGRGVAGEFANHFCFAYSPSNATR